MHALPARSSWKLTTNAADIYRGSKRVIVNACLTALPGRFVGLSGENGAGKSTLLDAIAGCLTPARGAIHWQRSGETLPRLPNLGTELGAVLTTRFLYLDLTIRENLNIWWSLAGGRDLGWQSPLLEAFELGPQLEKKPAQVSAGYLQRVLLVRALALRPPIVVLDEPFAHLDRSGRALLLGELASIREARTATVVVVEHDSGLVSELLDEEWHVSRSGHVETQNLKAEGFGTVTVGTGLTD